MDTKLIKEFGSEILCYRIRTARQKKRMQYEDFDKQLIQLSKEESVLYSYKYNAEWEPLVPPVQRGWIRFFVLREDVARSKQAMFFQNILNKINTAYCYHRKDFKTKKRKLGRKIYVVQTQELMRPDEQEFQKLNFTDAEKKLFHAEYHYNKWSRKFILRFVFDEPWRFVLRVKPNMIEKQKKIDPVKESWLGEIHNYIKRNDYRKRMQRILDGHYKYTHWKQREEDKAGEKYTFKNKSLSAILDITREEVL